MKGFLKKAKLSAKQQAEDIFDNMLNSAYCNHHIDPIWYIEEVSKNINSLKTEFIQKSYKQHSTFSVKNYIEELFDEEKQTLVTLRKVDTF